MNFDFTEDEEMLKALVERFAEDHYDLDRRRGYVASPFGFSPATWASLGELGLISAPFSADDGGFGLDATSVAIMFEAFGNGMMVEPLAENILLAGRLFARIAHGPLRDEWLADIVSGARRIAFALAETGGRNGHLWVATQAADAGDSASISLSGAKSCVPSGAGVDGYIISARTAGSPADADGLAFYFVEAGAPGVQATAWRMADGSAAASLVLDGASVPATHRLNGTLADVDAVAVLASFARSAESLGIMQRMMDETLSYLRTREQFGAPLGSFQTIQHRMAAQYAAIEQARALINLAIVSTNDADFARAVAGARAFIAPAAITLGHEMIQFHGGMGITDELAIGHGHKRLMVYSRWPEDPDAALDRFADLH
ncbi:MAG: acyl-CoA dehydrogenase family protein [Sphingopyxis sp.]